MGKKRDKRSELIIRIFDVGHGDSILIEFPDKKHVGIIDCHTHGHSHRGCGAKSWDKSEPKVLTYLRNRLDKGEELIVAFVCLSHFHHDHYLGFGRLIKEIEKRKVIEPFKSEGMELSPLVKPQWQICNIANVYIDILAPNGWHWEDYNKFLLSPDWKRYSKENKRHTDEHLVCSAIMLRYGKARVLLGADLTCCAWDKVIDRWGKDIKAHAAKVSHHGSYDGNFLPPDSLHGQSLWEYIRIKGLTVAVISGGYRKNLPHVDTIIELKAKGVNTYCTGDFTRLFRHDPILRSKLVEDVSEHIASTSEPIIEHTHTYHGDIMLRVCDDGKVRPKTEYNLPNL